PLEKMGEKIEVVDRVGHGHADVDARPLESRESPGAVPNGTHVTVREPAAQHVGDRMEPEDMADLEDACRAALQFRQRAALGGRDCGRFSDEARLAGFETLARQPKMRVGWRDEIDRVHMRKDGANIRDRPRRGYARLHGEGTAVLREVGDPELDSELREHPEVLLAPATETDQENLQWRVAASPPRSSGIS